MGHNRYGPPPKTREFDELVEYALGGGRGAPATPLGMDVGRIADKTLGAAQDGLERAVNDLVLQRAFYLMTQIVLAARMPDWADRLKKFDIHLSETSTPFDLTVEVHTALDNYRTKIRGSSDVGEMAQQALGESLSELAAKNTASLFGIGSNDLQDAVKRLSTKAGFANLGQKFFGNFMARYLNFFLSRITANQVGSKRLRTIGGISEFDEALRLHCHESAKIVHRFCGEWYSKTEFQEGINEENSFGFMAHALTKLRDELRLQEVGQ